MKIRVICIRVKLKYDCCVPRRRNKAVGKPCAERVFSIVSLKDPDDWIRAVTGEGLNVNYYLDYLEEKFSKLYELP